MCKVPMQLACSHDPEMSRSRQLLMLALAVPLAGCLSQSGSGPRGLSNASSPSESAASAADNVEPQNLPASPERIPPSPMAVQAGEPQDVTFPANWCDRAVPDAYDVLAGIATEYYNL